MRAMGRTPFEIVVESGGVEMCFLKPAPFSGRANELGEDFERERTDY